MTDEPLPAPAPFRLFISYAHKGEARKDRLLTHLSPYKRNGLIEAWTDRAIDAGDDWEAEIDQAMGEAHGAIFVLDEYFLASGFCMDTEVGHFLQRHRDEKVLILFVLADHCGWKAFDFIQKFQIVPRDNRPVTDFRPHSKAYTAVAEEIENALRNHREDHGLPRRASATPAAAAAEPTIGSLPYLLAKLPGRTSQLFGREAELAQLTAWRDHKGVFLWVADGGTGKSALIRWWLEQQVWPADTRFLGHSFYSQGSRNQATSGRGFLLDALSQLGVAHDTNASDDELGRMLAEAVGKTPTVLVLDGIEPLQQPSKDPKLNGTVKDRGLAALLEGLSRSPGQTLCLASSRLPIPDISIADSPYFKEKQLNILPPDSAVALLRQRGVAGINEDLAKMARRCGHHPLALVLAAEFCHTFLYDQAANFLARDWQPKTGEAHAATIMAWFDSALCQEHQALDRELARILGLFDRPAPWGALLALKETEPPIPGLTEVLHQATEPAILESLARLNQWGLLHAELEQKEPELDAHPLVREHFGTLLEKEAPEAFQAGHNVLFDWFCKLPDKDLPDTLAEQEPLYRAIGHGWKAGCYISALDEVYRRRIHRGDQGYGLFQLGGYSTSLASLAGFFPQGWDRPPVATDETMDEAACSWLLGEAAFCLMSLGRLEDALSPVRKVRQGKQATGEWNLFCRSSECLVDLLTPLGRWAEAEKVSREAKNVASRISNDQERWQRRVAFLAYLGRALHGQGRLAESVAAFAKAEAVQAGTGHHPMLYSLYGYDYAQLLLELTGQPTGWRAVAERGRSALNIDDGLAYFSRARNHYTIGRALAALNEAEAGPALDLSVTLVQQAGSIYHQPPMYLARGQYLRATLQLPSAWADHDAAYAIAQRGNMRTYLAECGLLAGNLCLDERPVRLAEAAAHYATAAQLIREDGYGRRLAELYLLHARLLHAQHDPNAAEALVQAETRIREVGQWFFWRELQAVAQEIGAPDPGECPAPGV